MDLPIEKLEKFTLEDFINIYRFYLCKGTISQNQIASFLQFDSDQIAIINAPPDHFSKCEKLYELIQKKTTAAKFLEALENTGNEHIIKFIKEMDFSALAETASTSANPNRRRGLWFNIPEPIESFCGREGFLANLHDKLKPRDDSTTEVTILSQVKIVSGLGGIGKTETATKYVREQQKFYNNFIWINAANESTMTNSFMKLAEEIRIPVRNTEGKSREIQDIVRDSYNKICDNGISNLIVFDNAEDYDSCKKFFPASLHPDLVKPVILATSRNQEWNLTKGKIQVLPLDVMTESESLELILKQLEITDLNISEFKEESKEFIQLLGGLPLALQQAVAYVKHQKKVNAILGRPYKITDYVKAFKSSSEKLQNFPQAQDSSTTVFVTWNLTLEKIKEDELYGTIAIEIIEVMSFLYADKIPVAFILQLLPFPPPPQDGIKRRRILFPQQQDDCQSTNLVEGLKILEKFSMIKITDTFVSIHRQVQFVIIHGLKRLGGLIKLFDHLVEKCELMLKNTKMSESSDIFLNVDQIVNNQLDLIPLNEKFLDFMDDFGNILWEAGRYSESLNLHQKVYNKRVELLGENHQNTLVTQNDIALQLKELGRYDEALILFKETLNKKEIHLGVDHPTTITTKHNLAAVLREQGKYKESLEIFQQVLDQRNKIHGENHPKTLLTHNAISLVYFKLGDHFKALSLLGKLEKKQTEVLGPDHREVLTTKYNKASVLFKMGKLEEASRIFNEVYEKRKETFGENHLSTISALAGILDVLEREGKFTEALEMSKKVYEVRKTSLGENHPLTDVAKHKIVHVERRMLTKMCCCNPDFWVDRK